MNKTAVKNFAIWARKKLISDIRSKARLISITKMVLMNAASVGNRFPVFNIGSKTEPY